MSTARAGWQPDPLGRYTYRYWDGARWTDHVSLDGQVGRDLFGATPKALQPPPLSPSSEPSYPPPTNRKVKPVLLIAFAGAIGVAVLIVAATRGGSSDPLHPPLTAVQAYSACREALGQRGESAPDRLNDPGVVERPHQGDRVFEFVVNDTHRCTVRDLHNGKVEVGTD